MAGRQIAVDPGNQPCQTRGWPPGREASSMNEAPNPTVELVRAFLHEQVGFSDSGSLREPLVVDAMALFDAAPEAYMRLPDFDSLQELLREAAACVRETGLCVRLKHIPGAFWARSSVSLLRVADKNRFIRFMGTVTRAGPAKVVQEMRGFQCEECRNQFFRRVSPAAGYEFEVPTECSSGAKHSSWDSRAKRVKTTKCHSKNFKTLPADDACWNNFQELRVQDPMSAVDAGVVPTSIAVVLFGDLVGQVQPGDSVSVEGCVRQRFRPPWQGKRLEVELFLEASHVERKATEPTAACASAEDAEDFKKFWSQCKNDEWRGRSNILRATAPWLEGMAVPKLALLLTLIGGSPSSDARLGSAENGQRASEGRWDQYRPLDPAADASGQITTGAKEGNDAGDGSGGGRTTPHLLLLGDPGTGKSQLLQAAQELMTRSVRTSGLGCSNAGLTCAAVKDGPDFALEAGALVLADGGVCCIDEFSTIRSHDRAAVHEAMEQQTVSVAKAGFICRLRSRCSVIAAQNCKGGSLQKRGASYDRGESLVVNSGLPPPLLSRFDLVVVFADSRRKEAESAKADLILASSPAKVDPGSPRTGPATGQAAEHVGAHGIWNHDKLRRYITWARGNVLAGEPDPHAVTVLSSYFRVIRSGPGRGNGVTVRAFESILRLSQAHARLLHHSRVELEDAVAAVVVHFACLQDHIVGADAMGDDGEGSFEPTMRDPNDETPVCGVGVQLPGLHHGTDIADVEQYRKLEAQILRRLHLARNLDGGIEDLGMPTPQQHAPPAPLADIGRLTASPTQGGTPSPGSKDGASQDLSHARRGRRFGSRMC